MSGQHRSQVSGERSAQVTGHRSGVSAAVSGQPVGGQRSAGQRRGGDGAVLSRDRRPDAGFGIEGTERKLTDGRRRAAK